MAFTRAQQKEFFPLKAAAWQIHAARQGLDLKNKELLDAWYRGQLEQATGKASTTECNAGRHFERACAWFEELGELGIKYQLRLLAGDLKRIKFAVSKINPSWLAQFRSDAQLQTYLDGVTCQAFRRDQPIPLHEMSDAQLQVITRATCIAAKRAIG